VVSVLDKEVIVKLRDIMINVMAGMLLSSGQLQNAFQRQAQLAL